MASETNTPLGAALRASEVRYRRLFETAKDGILILDADTGVIVDANPFLESLLGFSHDELVGKALWELGPFHDIAASQEAFERLQSTEYARYDNLPLQTKGKEFRAVEFISNVYLVNGKRVIQCNIRDNTERRRAAGQLQAANEELAALVAELRQRDSEMQLLHRMSSLLQACHTQDEACRVVALMAGELFAGQDGCLAIARPGRHDLEIVASWGQASSSFANFALHDCWGLRRGQPHEVQDTGSGLLCAHFTARPQSGYLCVPLTVQGESLGVLCLMTDQAGSGDHRLGRRNTAITLGEAIKLSLYNLRLQTKLREQANRDPLTGLFNRRYLVDSLDRELHRAQRQGTALGLVVLDLDHFKNFNDSYGHEAGDLLLQNVGEILRAAVRQSDIVCRYGGEEFVLVMPESPSADTCRRVDELRVLVRNLTIRHEDRLLGSITVSAGVAVAPGDGLSARDLFAAADAALYAAKSGGRDRLVCSGAAAAALPPAMRQEQSPRPTGLAEPAGARLRGPRRAPD
ncbi:MAG: diguanylate cyclase [Candidatus Krumholzibacteriia bacterium]